MRIPSDLRDLYGRIKNQETPVSFYELDEADREKAYRLISLKAVKTHVNDGDLILASGDTRSWKLILGALKAPKRVA